jgi:hypothetical protein
VLGLLVAGSGQADRSTDLLKTLKNRFRNRTLKGETAEYFDEYCCSPCTVSRNSLEVNYLINEADRARRAAMQSGGVPQAQKMAPVQNFQAPNPQQWNSQQWNPQRAHFSRLE